MISEVYIVIVTFNGMKWLYKTLESIPENYNIIVVDNNSTDDTVNFVQTNYPEIQLLPQMVNLGFGRGNNIGITYALNQNANYVFLLNQDAYLQNDTISKLVEVHKQNQEFGILSPIHLNGNNLKLDRNFSRYIGHDRNPNLYLDAFKDKLKLIYKFPFINAAAWLIPTKAIKDIGGFDPFFFHYGEDDNYCHRMLYHGYQIGVVPNSYISHDRSQKLKDKSKSSLKEQLKVKEREYKIQYCNILNDDFPINYNNKKNYVKRQIIKNILKLNFNKTHYLIKEYFMMKRINSSVKQSRELNTIKGSHYL